MPFPWIAAAMIASAAASAAAQRNAARQNRLAAEAANTASASQADQQVAYQREFAQNGIQWRVDDARRAGLHPLFALGAATPSYQPVQQTFHMAPAADYSSSIQQGFRGLAAWADENRAYRESELYGPPMSAFEEPVATSWAIRDPSPASYTELAAVSPQIPPPYGMTSHTEKPSMAYWAVPEIGKVIAPDASNFSESMESLDSVTGQALILYLNRNLSDKALRWIQSQMPTLPDATRWTLDGLLKLGQGIANTGKRINDFSMGR